MMRNTARAVRDLAGKPLIDGDDPEKTRHLWVNQVICAALLAAPRQGEKPKSFEEQITLYNLAKRIADSPARVELSAEEIVTIKRAVADRFVPLVTGFVAMVLESDEAPGEA